jgi:hypothetical protein
LPPWSAKLAAECAVEEEGEWHAIQQEDGDAAAIEFIKRAPARYTEAKCSLGTAVHAACERYPNLDGLSADVLPYIEQYARFLDEKSVTVIEQERTVLRGMSDERGYAGTLDMRVEIDGEIAIGDIKTGGVWPEAALQLAAYAHASHEVEGERVIRIQHVPSTAFVLELKPRSYRIHRCEITEGTLAAFQAAYRLHVWRETAAKSALVVE